MKNLLKGKAATILVVLSTFVLAGIAIFTAVRLYQLRNTSVAPNAPSSNPNAGGAACALSFNLSTSTSSPTPTPSSTPTGSPTPTPTATPTATPVPQCNAACTADSQCPSSLMCSIESGETSGFCRKAACETSEDCLCSTPTPTPTPTATPSPTPTETPVATITPTPIPSAWVNSCNGACSSNSNCATGMICYQGVCRNPSCTGASDCQCSVVAAAAATPTAAPTLPNSGTDWPTYLGAGIGIFVILTSILLAL